MAIDQRPMELGFTVSALSAVRKAVATAVTKRVLKPREQTYCVEFDAYAAIRLSRLPVVDAPVDNREVGFTLQVECARSIIAAIDAFLSGPATWEITERRCDDVKTYLNGKIAAMPSVLTQGKLKLNVSSKSELT